MKQQQKTLVGRMVTRAKTKEMLFYLTANWESRKICAASTGRKNSGTNRFLVDPRKKVCKRSKSMVDKTSTKQTKLKICKSLKVVRIGLDSTMATASP